jgi:hypothetical protein
VILALSSRRDLNKRVKFYRHAFPKDSQMVTCRNRSARRKNPIPTLKKKCSDLNNRAFAGVLLRVTSRNRFGRRKNPCNTCHAGFLQKRRKGRGNGCKLTTRHLFSASQRRKPAAMLPFSQPISDFRGSKPNKTARGRGGSARRRRQKARIDKLARKIYAKGRPHSALLRSKKTRVANAAQRRTGPAGAFP